MTACPGEQRQAEAALSPRPLDVEDATVIANYTAGGLLLLSLATAHPALGRVGRLVLTDDFFPMAQARRLASEFPRATLVSVPGAKTWVPVDSPVAVADAIAGFVPTLVP
jgi:hypothetical protein